MNTRVIHSSRRKNKGYSYITISFLVLSIMLLCLGLYVYFQDNQTAGVFDSFEDRVVKKQKSLMRKQLPENFQEMPAFIQAMPISPKDRDIDMNGLRDDVQVLIAYKFPDQPRYRAGLIQLSKVIVELSQIRKYDKIRHIAHTLNRHDQAEGCIVDIGINPAVVEEVKNKILNTYSRRTNYELALERSSDVPDELIRPIPSTPCDHILTENEIALQKWNPNEDKS